MGVRFALVCALLLFGTALSALTGQQLVDLINNSNLTFKAQLHEQFDGITLAELEHRHGRSSPRFQNKQDQKIKAKKLIVDQKLASSSDPISHFTVWDRWPECNFTFQHVQNQGKKCSAGWAFSVSETLSDRRCIQGGNWDALSAWDLVSCCDTCKYDASNGCNNGDAYEGFIYATNQGVVSGGDYYHHEGCKPYPIKPESNDPIDSTSCSRKCQSTYAKNYYDDRFFISDFVFLDPSETLIKNEILTFGTVSARMDLYVDFLYYTGGVYSHQIGEGLGVHFVKIVGWGTTDDGTKYWLGVNSFGHMWGEAGFFKILRGSNECGIEQGVISPILPDVQPTGQTIPPGQSTTPFVPTRAPDSQFIPCSKRIVVAIDNAKFNPYILQTKSFLMNQVFAGNWNHTERLGLLWYSNIFERYIPFQYFDDSKNGLDLVRKLVESQGQRKQTTSSLAAGLQSVLDHFKTNSDYRRLASIVFVSQKIDQQVIDSSKTLAKKLALNGNRLAIIGLGDIDPNGLLKQLTHHYTTGKKFFWKEGYGCLGSPPSDAPTVGTEPTVTFPIIPTPPAPVPCAGHLFVFLDTSKTLTDGQFGDQKSFVGQSMFGIGFNNYDRLGLGFCGPFGGYLERVFDSLRKPSDVTSYVNSIKKDSKDDASLSRCIDAIVDQKIADGVSDPVTVAIHVSSITQDIADKAQASAQNLQAQGIKLVLIAHGSKANLDLLQQVVGSSGQVLSWSINSKTPPNSRQWVSTIMGCGAGTGTTTQPQVDFMPCKKRIAFAIDNAKSNQWIKQQKSFFINEVFAGNWNHLERLALLWYAEKNEYWVPFGFFNDNTAKNLSFVRELVASKFPIQKTTPTLTVAFQALLDKYSTNDDFAEVASIVFYSQVLDQTTVDKSLQLANDLNSNGHKLAIVGVGDVDPNGLLKQLTNNYAVWKDPSTDPKLPNWEQFFWDQAYGCSSQVPSDPPTIGTVPTVTFPAIKTTTPIVTTVPPSEALFWRDISDHDFVGQQMFADAIFNEYNRLGLGVCTRAGGSVDNGFGSILSSADVSTYVDSVTRNSKYSAQLYKCINAIALLDLASQTDVPITVAIHVSSITSEEVEFTTESAKNLQDQGIRLVLIAHGDNADTTLLGEIVGDPSVVYKWPTDSSAPSNPSEWITDIMNCPA
ncbi:Cysteine endopeptidase [Aphelenchoides bicaudatus]|nr:Cysteine endopeptidase [Aphelenchoides bicaudatus]